jgi:4'-phosphopantetheinyl transferase superfamily
MQGATVGRDVWFEPLTVTEFDVAELGDGCVVNRNAVVETHLFHDRLMRIGPSKLGAGATLGPAAAMLPDTSIGEHCTIGARSVVMRGERLPTRTRWHGAPVGIDTERVEILDRRFAASVCTPTARLDRVALHDPQADVSPLWSSKEARAKALGEPVSYDPRWPGAPMFWPEGRAGCWQSASLPVANGHVAWLCWRLA